MVEWGLPIRRREAFLGLLHPALEACRPLTGDVAAKLVTVVGAESAQGPGHMLGLEDSKEQSLHIYLLPQSSASSNQSRKYTPPLALVTVISDGPS